MKAAALVSLIAASLMAAPASADIARVWAVDDGEKVKRGDLRHPLAESPENAVWDGQSIYLFGARNEVIAFQLILEAGGAGVAEASVTLDALSGPGYTIGNDGGADPFDYVGTRIELFTEHYVNVTTRTNTGSAWDSNSAPMDIHGEDYVGWIPDALIPFAAPAGLGGAPFSIQPRTNQGVWVDIYIPREAPPGEYRGMLTVTEAGKTAYRLPVSLHVYGFSLPDEVHARNFFFADAREIVAAFGVGKGSSEYDAIEGRYQQMGHRHRLDLTFNVTLEEMERRYGQYITGEYYTKQHHYEGPGEGVGHGTYSIGTYDQPGGEQSGFVPDTEEGWRAASDAWVTWFSQHAPDTVIFKYMRDEPFVGGGSLDQASTEREARLDQIRARCDWLHHNPGPGGRLMALATTGGTNCRVRRALDGYVNFWQTTGNVSYTYASGLIVPSIADLHAQGSRVGFYNGFRPNFGSAQIDTDAVDYRVDPWIMWKYDVDQYFMWHVNFYHQGRQRINVFRDTYRSYGKQDGRISWGNGILFYPGEDHEFPQEDRGLAGPIASMRVKNWRRGEQDYEYLWLAKRAGLDEQLKGMVDAVVPEALSDCQQNAPAPWATRGYQYERQRRQLAELLEEQVTGAGR